MPESEITASAAAARIGPGCRVTLHFSLELADGSVVDSNFEGTPGTFTMGDGSLLPGFEAALTGLQVDEVVDVLLPAEQAFGEVNAGNVQVLPRQRFAALLANSTDPVQPGTVLSFTDAGGFEIPGVVKSIDDATLVVDFNHPLAGREIRFKARILSVVPADVQVMEIK